MVVRHGQVGMNGPTLLDAHVKITNFQICVNGMGRTEVDGPTVHLTTSQLTNSQPQRHVVLVGVARLVKTPHGLLLPQHPPQLYLAVTKDTRTLSTVHAKARHAAIIALTRVWSPVVRVNSAPKLHLRCPQRLPRLCNQPNHPQRHLLFPQHNRPLMTHAVCIRAVWIATTSVVGTLTPWRAELDLSTIVWIPLARASTRAATTLILPTTLKMKHTAHR